MKLSAGECVATVSGRITSPFPKTDLTNNRKAINTLKRIDAWLIAEAINEAEYIHDDYVKSILLKVNDKLSKADRDCINVLLFGDCD